MAKQTKTPNKKGSLKDKFGIFTKKTDDFFEITKRGSNFKTEIIAGLTTFFAMAYIVVTNPNQIVSFNATFGSGWLKSDFDRIWYSVYVASILVAVIGTLLYAFYAKMPFAQACGMGLNSFFFVSFILPELLKEDETTNIIKGYKEGLSVILLSGIIFMILSFTGLRTYIAKSLPDNLKKAIPAGIGLFIAFIGFQNVGIIQPNQYTLVQFFDFHGAWVNAATPLDGWRAIAPVLIALLGLIIMGVLNKFKVKGSVIITILGSTVLYYLVTWQAPSFSLTSIGDSFYCFGKYGLFGAFEGFATLFTTGGVFTWSTLFSVIALTITFTLVDMFDSI